MKLGVPSKEPSSQSSPDVVESSNPNQASTCSQSSQPFHQATGSTTCTELNQCSSQASTSSMSIQPSHQGTASTTELKQSSSQASISSELSQPSHQGTASTTSQPSSQNPKASSLVIKKIDSTNQKHVENIIDKLLKLEGFEPILLQKLISFVTSSSDDTKSKAFVGKVMKNNTLLSCIHNRLIDEVEENMMIICSKAWKKPYTTVLQNTDADALLNFKWDVVLDEFGKKFPFLFNMFSKVMTNDETKDGKEAEFQRVTPRLGMLYCNMIQSRYQECSLGQKMVTCSLIDDIADQKLYDILQPLGISMCHQSALRIINHLASKSHKVLLDCLKAGMQLHWVTDNLNVVKKVAFLRQKDEGKKSTMYNMMATGALLTDYHFPPTLSTQTPQQDFRQFLMEHFKFTDADWALTKQNFLIHLARKASTLPQFQFLKPALPKYIRGEFTELIAKKTKAIALDTLDLNEMFLQDDVKILQFFQQKTEELFTEAEIELTSRSSVAGDQLTAEKLRVAKALMHRELTASGRFENLGPITFLFFHLMMNLLILIIGILHKEESLSEVGTLKAEISRIMRKNFDVDVRKAYKADTDLMDVFGGAYLIELICHWFGMSSLTDAPTKNVPPTSFKDESEIRQWMEDTFGALLDTIIWPRLQGTEEVEEDGTIYAVRLPDGTPLNLKVPSSPPEKDYVQNYALQVVEFELVRQELMDSCKLPDRHRTIRLIKLLMMFFKADKPGVSKYGVECLIFLLQQQYLLSERDANDAFYAMFVNTKGKVDTFVPADMWMEWTVRVIKKHINHLMGNKNSSIIQKKSRSLCAVSEIAENFKAECDSVIRCKKHKTPDNKADEESIWNDVHSIKPFQFTPSREFPSFPEMPPSMRARLNAVRYDAWIRTRVPHYGVHFGVA